MSVVTFDSIRGTKSDSPNKYTLLPVYTSNCTTVFVDTIYIIHKTLYLFHELYSNTNFISGVLLVFSLCTKDYINGRELKV